MQECLVLRDFNCDMQRNLPEMRKLKSLMLQFQFCQLIQKPTRITATSSTLIDLVFSTNVEKIGKAGVIHLSISDHSLVYVVRQARSIKQPPKTITLRTYNTYNDKKFIEDIQSAPFQIIESCDDPDTCWSLWKTMFTEVCHNYVPMAT